MGSGVRKAAKGLPMGNSGARLSMMTSIGLLLAGCAGGAVADAGPAVQVADIASGQQDYDANLPGAYVMRPNDSISINVFREDDLSIDSIQISGDGTVSMPLLGRLQASGKEPAVFAAEIEQLLNARYLRNATVAVNVLEYGSHLVTVEGAVEQPGIYRFAPGTRLSGSIALASGPSRVADRQQIAVFRQSPEGMQIAKFDLSSLQRGTMMDPVLVPGDRVVVGTDGLSQFWQDMIRALPVFALFTRI